MSIRVCLTLLAYDIILETLFQCILADLDLRLP